MRLHRVRLQDVRGVDACDVHFSSDGVTVVEAPNESGKTTLLDAVDVLLEFKDSSNAQRVRDLQPVDRDVASTIEVELSCGGTHLTCTKTYNRQKATVLRIHRPAPETLRGTDAHDRLRQVLESDVDLALYRALRLTQGRDLDAIALGDSAVLAARLDEAAGGAGSTDDTGLLDRVAQEYARWFTPTGKEGRALSTLQEAREAAEHEHAELVARVQALQDDVDELARIERELPELARRRDAELRPALEAAEEAAARISQVRTVHRQRCAERDAAQAALEAAQAAVHQRQELATQIEEVEADVARLDEELGPARARLQELDGQRARLVAAWEEAQGEAREARQHHERAQLAVDLRTALDERDRLAAQHERVRALLDDARDAERALAAIRLDATSLQAIRSAAEDVRVAHATLAAAAPSLRLRAQRDLDVEVDGHRSVLAAGDELNRTVGDRLVIDVPGVLGLDLEAGTSAGGPARAVQDAEQALAEACRQAGVADPAAAEELREERRRHEGAVDRRDAELERTLEGRSVDDLSTELHAAEDRVGALQGQLGDADLPADLATARAVLDAARTRARDADAAVEQARSALDEVTTHVGEQRTRVEVADSRLATRREELARLDQRLEVARAEADDAALQDAVEAASEGLAGAVAAVRAVEQELDALDPEAAELELTNLRAQLDDLVVRVGELETRAVRLREGLRIRGEEGLGERLQEAAIRLERARADHDRAQARASAAALLYEELRRARDDAYRAYRAPLRELIGRQARLLFGGDVEVELDDDLRIICRTLDGVTLGWEQLSAGAREQLAVLSALAAAQLAGPDGVPFVLDDALGYTDPQRLERLGALLGRTSTAQVIVLTCVADRFRHVGGATTVRLREVADAARAVPDDHASAPSDAPPSADDTAPRLDLDRPGG